MIIKTLSVAPIGTNCYIIGCQETKEAIIIDPGGEGSRILDAVEQEQLTLKYIINTHAHFDHVGAVNDIQEKTGVPFYLHQGDEPFIEPAAFSQSLQMFGMPPMQPPKIDEYIDPEKTYKVGNISFSVLETPGHSPGGVCFLFENDVFVGDTLFAGSIGRTDLPGGDMGTLMQSIKTQLMSLNDSITVHCGHMGDTSIGNERQFNPFNQYWT